MDSRAKQYRQNITHTPLLTPPVDEIHLIDTDGVITNTEKTIIEQRWSLHQLEDYYTNRWQITYDSLAQLDWNLYAKTYSKASTIHQNYMLKMITGWLPVQHHLNKMNSDQKKCHLCNNDETIAHLFQCPSRQQWRTHFNAQLQDQLKKYPPPLETQHHIHQFISDIFHNTTQFQHFHHFKIFAGIFPNSWSIDTSYVTNDSNTSKITHWQIKLSLWLVHKGHELWTQRNSNLYERNKSSTTMERVLNTKISQLSVSYTHLTLPTIA